MKQIPRTGEFAYLLGALYGDGTSYKNKANQAYVVTIDQKKKDWLKGHVKPLVEKLGFRPTFYSFMTGDYKKWRLTMYSKSLFETFRAMKKDVLLYVESLGRSEFLQFVAGLFDTEGSITDRINIYNKNKELLDLIVLRLSEINISAKVYRYGKVHGIYIYRKAEVQKFFDHVPFKGKTKTPSG